VRQPPRPEVIKWEQLDGGDLRDVVRAGAGEPRIASSSRRTWASRHGTR